MASSSVRYSLMETGSLWLLSLRKKSISMGIRGQGRNYSCPRARWRIITTLTPNSKEVSHDHHPRPADLAHRRHPDPHHAAAAQLHRRALPDYHRDRGPVRSDPHRALLTTTTTIALCIAAGRDRARPGDRTRAPGTRIR